MAEASVAEKRPRFRRRRFLLQPGYQLRMAAAILLFISAYSLLLGFLIFYPLHQAFMATADPEEQFRIAREVIDLHGRFWPSVLAVGVLVAVQSIFVTHRVIGPASQLRRILEGFAVGRYDMRVRLRRGDRLKELETALNDLGEDLQQRKQSRQRQADRLQAALEELKTGAGGATLPPSLQRAIDEIGRSAFEFSRAD